MIALDRPSTGTYRHVPADVVGCTNESGRRCSCSLDMLDCNALRRNTNPAQDNPAITDGCDGRPHLSGEAQHSKGSRVTIDDHRDVLFSDGERVGRLRVRDHQGKNPAVVDRLEGSLDNEEAAPVAKAQVDRHGRVAMGAETLSGFLSDGSIDRRTQSFLRSPAKSCRLLCSTAGALHTRNASGGFAAVLKRERGGDRVCSQRSVTGA